MVARCVSGSFQESLGSSAMDSFLTVGAMRLRLTNPGFSCRHGEFGDVVELSSNLSAQRLSVLRVERLVVSRLTLPIILNINPLGKLFHPARECNREKKPKAQ